MSKAARNPREQCTGNVAVTTYNPQEGSSKSNKVPSLDISAEQDAENSVEEELFKVDPFEEAIEEFEKLSWRKQQLILGRLVLMEQVVSLKLLPLGMGLFTLVVGGVITWAIKANVEANLFLIGSLGLAAVQLFLLVRMRKHRVQDARLNAWTAVLEASHALRTKSEEERWKQVQSITPPQLALASPQNTPQLEPPTSPQVAHRASSRKS